MDPDILNHTSKLLTEIVEGIKSYTTNSRDSEKKAIEPKPTPKLISSSNAVMSHKADKIEENPIAETDKKCFIMLENNPEVMNPLAHKLGLSPELAFHDVYSLTDPDLLAMIPRPAHALLFIFPGTTAYAEAHEAEESTREVYNGSGEEEPIMWFRQTIGNACGLIGLLHCVANGIPRTRVLPDSDLDQLLKQAVPLKPAERAQLLYDSDKLEAAHAESAVRGQSEVIPAHLHGDQHFIAFARGKDGCLWDLSGGSKGPVNLGKMDDGEDMLSPRVVDMGVGRYVKREIEEGDAVLRFSLCALCPADFER